MLYFNHLKHSWDNVKVRIMMTIPDIRIILPAVQTLKVFFRCRSTARHYDYRTLERGQVCQPRPELGKVRLTELAENTK